VKAFVRGPIRVSRFSLVPQEQSMSKLEILSPLPGTFFRRPSPDSPPFKADGEAVAVGDVIGLVEVMKNFQEVVAEVGGSAIHYKVEDAEAVMAGHLIAELEP
jgi:acetyl-CoA carboxylase biotin carboxyl carrier protein